MQLLNVRKLFRAGVQGSIVTAAMAGILILVFFANTLLQLENTEHVFFIFRLTVPIAAAFVIKLMMTHKNGGVLSEKHKKSMNKIYIYLIIFYVVNESLISVGVS
jgi:hypothetical protein